MKLPVDQRLIISLYDKTGNWPKPYRKRGYPVMLWDKKVEGCILEGFTRLINNIENAAINGYYLYGIFAAPPCTDFASSGARHFVNKDAAAPPAGDIWNSVEYHKSYVLIVLHLISEIKRLGLDQYLNFWVLENPVGRIESLVQEIKPFRKMLFNPCDYGDPYTKKTVLWGEFNSQLPLNPVLPIRVCEQGSWLQQLGGKSEKTKELRSATPMGFANAFFQANQ